jgi:hypothetical protein
MSERDDYVEQGQPSNRLLTILARRRWLWLSLLVLANLVGGGVWWHIREASRPVSDLERHDPIEDDARARPILEQAGLDAEQELAARGIKPHLGYCHVFWHTKKRILKEKFGIDWRTPAEMNPHVYYD